MLCICLLLVGCNKAETGDNNTEENKTVTENKTTEVTDNETGVLICSKSTKSTVEFVTEMQYNFENGKLTKLGVKYTYDLSGYTDEQRKAFNDSKMCETEAIKTTLGMIDCKEELSGTNYIVSGYTDKLRDQSTGGIKENKASYEQEGWTCTVK